MTENTPAGWYADPQLAEVVRYWDGARWTEHTAQSAPRRSVTPAGWHPDPQMAGQQRYWNGAQWTERTAPLGQGVVPRSGSLPTVIEPVTISLRQSWIRRHKVLSSLSALVVVAAIAGALGSSGDSGRAPKDTGAAKSSPRAPSSSSQAAEPRANQTPESSAATDPTGPIESTEPTKPAKTTMPRVAGLTREEAEQALAAAGLSVREVREIPSAQPTGTVLRQRKQVGAPIRAGSAVVLLVAAAYPSVPAVVGRLKQAAVSRLQAAGFKVTTTTESRTSGRDGVVLRQSPEGTELAKPGSAVTVVLSDVHHVAPPAQNCTPGYRPCLVPASDYDCAGGSGDGPAYANGPIYVTGSDPYDLDADGDGVACVS